MALKVKPKRFGPVFVHFDGAGSVTFATDAAGPQHNYPPFDAPVSTMLASIGHCLVESMRIVARRDGVGLSPFSVSVDAQKAVDLPGRLQSVHCRVHGEFVDEPAVADDMVAQAKSICTLSNTLNCDITVERTQAERPA